MSIGVWSTVCPPIFSVCIYRDYLDFIYNQINEWLAEEGTLTIGQITKAYDLPSDFLREVRKCGQKLIDK